MIVDHRPRLPNVIFEVTTRCNLSCRYCYVPWEAPATPLARTRDAGFAGVERTLNRLLAVANVGCVTMSGGEPLLVPRLAEHVLTCGLRGAAVNVITNGTAGTREDYRQLMAVGARLFELPLLSAAPAIHDRLTNQPGAWARVVRSCEDLRSLGAEVLVAVVVTRENLDGLADCLRFLADLGLRRVMLNRFNPGGRGLRDLAALSPGVDALRAAFAIADRVAPELGLAITSNVAVPHCVIDPLNFRHLSFTSCSADPARRPLALDAAGGLRFCNHSPVVFGNIFASPLEELLDGGYLRRWRTETPPGCDGCHRYARCFGGCRAACEQMGRSLADADPLLAG